MTERRKLYRSRADKMLAGALGGWAEYLNVDSSFVRIGYVVLTLLTGIFPGFILYVLMVIIIPVEPESASD